MGLPEIVRLLDVVLPEDVHGGALLLLSPAKGGSMKVKTAVQVGKQKSWNPANF